ncbi:uncharacterized protein [Dermacentor albipictus]|uniref:uncharacterized protein n=1 Tax=Dermacentor albipictus TaxID=60249 RepID=UPI0031FD7F05
MECLESLYYSPSDEPHPRDKHESRSPLEAVAKTRCTALDEPAPCASYKRRSTSPWELSSSASISATLATKHTRRPKDIIRWLQGQVSKYKKTIARLQKRQLCSGEGRQQLPRPRTGEGTFVSWPATTPAPEPRLRRRGFVPRPRSNPTLP